MDSYYICTIVAKNYISFARTLCSSFLEHHPDGKCFVLIIDDIESYINPSEEPFEVLSPKVLEIRDWPDFSFKYNITELATALKPYLLKYLLHKEELDKILYLDPDIMVLKSLKGLYERLDDGDIVLTPHLDADYPDDGLLPGDAHIMRSGIYNLGFIGIRNSSNGLDFLRWWQQKLYDRCVINHKAGYFVDQKFVDYALPLFDGIEIIRDPGYNVAYWNLHSRIIGWNGSEWTCNGGCLYFFHFSDFKPQKPDQISGHQNRYRLNAMPDLRRFFDVYLSLLQRNGYVESSQWPYTFNTYRNGARIRQSVRHLYRVFRKTPHADPFKKNNLSTVFQLSPYVLRRVLKKMRGLRIHL